MNPIISRSVKETQAFGRRLGALLQPGDWIGLSGDLGAGKTCLTQGLALGAGVSVETDVTSPTFVLLQTYPGRLPLHHLDLYRLHHMGELIEIGYQDLLAGPGACVVEWCDQVNGARPADGLVLAIELLDQDTRSLQPEALGERGRVLVQALLESG
jgi:tRNA threonylcarbamoyladenosine biosynthesis protein TsaE